MKLKNAHWTMQFIPRGKGEVKSIRFQTIPLFILVGITFLFFLLAIFTSLFLWFKYHDVVDQMKDALSTAEQVKLENEAYSQENERLRKSFDALNQDLLKLKEEVEKNQDYLEKLKELGGNNSPTSKGTEKEKNRSVTVASLTSPVKPAFAFENSPIYIEGIRQDLIHLSEELALQEETLTTLEARFKAHMEALQRIPMGYPTTGRVTSLFGIRKDPFTKRKKMHEGIDFADRYGTAIHATAKGRVTFTGWNGPYGKQVVIDHGNGYVTTYSHLSSITVKEGDLVERGDQIGRMGTTGRSTGVHLHYEVHKNGKPLDPKSFLGGEEIIAQEETTND